MSQAGALQGNELIEIIQSGMNKRLALSLLMTAGKSAYQSAVDLGYVGTLPAWLLSLRGATGSQGLQGLKGETGEQGLRGFTGTQGVQGVAGTPGLPGVNGAAGAKGDNGEQGVPGTPGAAGTPGIPGVAGPAGADGVDGIDGAPGVPGAAGSPGADGVPGVQGETGPAGADGVPGVPGVAGPAGVDGIDGAPGTPGVDGAVGKSAYQSAVDNGFAGTEAQWVESMQPAGQAGVVVVSHNFMTSQDLTEGMIVNIWNNAGTPNARRADGSIEGKHAHGFVITSTSAGQTATVYFAGVNDKCVDLVIGDQYLSVTPGITSPLTPNMSGHVLQTIGLAISDTTLFFNPSDAAILA